MIVELDNISHSCFFIPDTVELRNYSLAGSSCRKKKMVRGRLKTF